MAVLSFQSFNILNASGRSFFSIGWRCAGRRRRGADSFRGDDGLAAGTSDDPIGLAVFCLFRNVIIKNNLTFEKERGINIKACVA